VGVVALAAATSAQAAEPEGARVYRERCAACHGPEGKGDGPVSAALEPPPRNFRSEEFWKEADPEGLRETVRKGRPGTLMQAFGDVLSEAEIEAVVDHLSTFQPGGEHADSDHGQASDAGAREDPAGRADRP
jgi:high-affinity iron transporter